MSADAIEKNGMRLLRHALAEREILEQFLRSAHGFPVVQDLFDIALLFLGDARLFLSCFEGQDLSHSGLGSLDPGREHGFLRHQRRQQNGDVWQRTQHAVVSCHGGAGGAEQRD